jgi:hypothetical protein
VKSKFESGNGRHNIEIEFGEGKKVVHLNLRFPRLRKNLQRMLRWA